MKKTNFFFFLLLILVSCSKHESIHVEIYVPKNRIPTDEGISIPKNIPAVIRDKVLDTTIVRLNPKDSSFIFMGEFKSSTNDLPSTPLVTDEDILSYNPKSGKITFSEAASEKISKLKYDFYGTQFVITMNKNPVFNGYFVNGMSSVTSDTYFIEYLNVGSRKRTNEFEIFQGDGLRSVKIADLKESKFYKALESTNRIKK